MSDHRANRYSSHIPQQMQSRWTEDTRIEKDIHLLRLVDLDWTARANGAFVEASRLSLAIQDDTAMGTPGLNPIACLHAISVRLSDASAIAKAALTCAEAGSEHHALRIILDLDALLHEAATLHGALCLVGRLQHSRTGIAPEG